MSKKLETTLALTMAVISLAGCANSGFNQPLRSESLSSTSGYRDSFDAKGISTKFVTVSFKQDLDQAGRDRFAERYGTQFQRYIAPIKAAQILVPPGSTADSFVRELSKNTEIRSAELSSKAFIDMKVNDPKAKDQWSLEKISLPQAWDVTMGEASVKIAICDSGVDLDHPDLKDKIVPGYNVLDPKALPRDDGGHGTHVAGIVAASTNNGVGVAGIAAKCSIMPVKVLGEKGGSEATIAEGIVWAADHGADVINTSLGIHQESKVIEDAVKYALAKNVVFVASAGNNNQNEAIHLPSTVDGVIEVAATTSSDEKAKFSNWGQKLSVAAPGQKILSTFPTYKVSLNDSGYTKNYAVLDGTSMASPLVAGLAALIRSKHPGMKPAEVKKIIENSADDLGDKGYDKYFGWGRVNAAKALAK
ncbi:MAG TPA: S8 family peptidase [Chroococcales cyanobacterium]|jgi:subtilisin family serine protease